MDVESRMAFGVFPDGLDEVAIDGLIAEVAPGARCVVTSALLDGSAVERRRRRMARRVLAEVVRSLTAAGLVGGVSGQGKNDAVRASGAGRVWRVVTEKAAGPLLPGPGVSSGEVA